MAKTTVRIERLSIHIKGIAPALGRAAASGLGEALLDELGKRGSGFQGNRARAVAQLELPPLRADGPPTSAEIRRTVASACAEGIAAKVTESSRP